MPRRTASQEKKFRTVQGEKLQGIHSPFGGVSSYPKPHTNNEPVVEKQKAPALLLGLFYGAINGARTHDNRNHNPGLYQLSYDRRNLCI